ncbi:hypothetical protein GCM10025868_38620 [Angustibacter aerolatus]|uniref:Serine hydroxymethyltransferase-like domain-containing protein n=1 Tax=Angustibacter aerolatus TaxID=1162965 RepID=A0ABQ6JLF5_9ACTN|nr:hypothetical protein [Angustibacter aerolatus]GMA88612.1 hypothetical protein GCM10025868_38620 [Angustibacter aerolatus]
MMQGGPLMHSVAAKAVNFKECLQPEYQAYARQVIENSQALAAGLAEQGMRPVTGGTDTHLSLLDLTGTGVSGKDAEARCDAAGIVLNKNAIPFDPQPPSVASGVRVGTPSVTTQGMGTEQMATIAEAHRPGRDQGRRRPRGGRQPRRPGRRRRAWSGPSRRTRGADRPPAGVAACASTSSSCSSPRW